MQQITYQAPVPIIFAGEEIAIFAKPIIALNTHYVVKVTLYDSKGTSNIFQKDTQIVSDLILNRYKKSFKDKKIEVMVPHEFIPDHLLRVSYVTALTAGQLHMALGQSPDPQLIASIVYTWEKKENLQALGILSAVSTFGGIVFMRKEFEFLKSVHNLAIKIPQNIQNHLFFIKTNHKKIQFVYDEKKVFELEKMVKRLMVAIVKEDVFFFEESVKKIAELTKLYANFPEGFIPFSANEEFILGYADNANTAYIPFVQSYRGVENVSQLLLSKSGKSK